MSKKLDKRNVTISTCCYTNDDFRRLYRIFRLTLNPLLKEDDFKRYYCSTSLQYIDTTFLYDGDRLVGFCAAAFYNTTINKNNITIGRSAIGILEEYQGNGLPKGRLYYKYARYKLSKPFRKLVLTAYVANPIVYRMICKYTGIIYPRITLQVPEKIEQIKAFILENPVKQTELSPFVVRINFEVQKGEKLMNRLTATNNVHVQFFTSQTGLLEKVTLLVIIPISIINIFFTASLFLYHQFLRSRLLFFIAILQGFLKVIDKCRKMINLGLNNCKRAITQVKHGSWKRMRAVFSKPASNRNITESGFKAS